MSESASVSQEKDGVCNSESREDEGARELIDKLTKTEGNEFCADCGERSEATGTSVLSLKCAVKPNIPLQILSGLLSTLVSSYASNVQESTGV